VGSIYFLTALEDSTGLITATPIKTKGMALDVLNTCIKQLETLTGAKVKRVRHNGAKEYVTKDLKAWYEDKGITSEMTAPNKSQHNGKAERVNRTLMERVRAALLDAGAEEELWAEALASVIHVMNRSLKAGLAVTPLEALTGRLPNVAGFRAWRSRAWALKPKKQPRKLEQRTDVGRFVGDTVGGKAYRILEDETNQFFERRDVLIEENPAKVQTSAVGSSVGPRQTAEADADSVDGTEGEMDMLDAEGGRGDEYTPDETSTNDEYGIPPSLAEESEKEDDDGDGDSTPWDGQAPAVSESVAPGPRRSKRKPASKVTWWEKEPKAYLASRTKSADEAGCNLHKLPANEKEARARRDWPRWKQAIKKELAGHKKFGTWSKIKVNNKKHRAVKTRFVFDIKHDAEGKMTRYKARLVAQGFNQLPGSDFDETWTPVPNAATTRALFAVAAATVWEVTTAPSAVRSCAARQSDVPSREHRATPVGRRRCGGGGGTRLPAPCAPRHANVAVGAPARARGYGAGPSARYRCVAERATALKVRVLHERAWNCLRLIPGRDSRSDVGIPRPTSTAPHHFGI